MVSLIRTTQLAVNDVGGEIHRSRELCSNTCTRGSLGVDTERKINIVYKTNTKRLPLEMYEELRRDQQC